tara:strand:+ start:1202 stop:1831 length:630 start_codon:yes stop_codon:yes gene_type:complete
MIYIIITSSINNKIGKINPEQRKNRYIDCITELLDFIKNDDSFYPIIVENNGKRKTFLDDLKCDVFYTDNNKFKFSNKGGNELCDIKSVIKRYNIQDDDTIIKLTGRYKILDSKFLDLVKNNEKEYEAFVKFYNVSTRKFSEEMEDLVLGLYAVKCKYIKNFDYKYIKCPEAEFATYLKNTVAIDKISQLNYLGLECNFAEYVNYVLIV